MTEIVNYVNTLFKPRKRGMNMKKAWKRIMKYVAFSMVLIFSVIVSYKPITTYALSVTPVNVKMYTTSGTPVFVRVPVDDLTVTKRILEMGVDGIIFPMIQNYDHACEILSKTLYPPYGKRGCGPKGAVRYGIDSEPYYYKEGHLKMCRFVQIELKSAALDAERIASIPYLDGCVLGMHDLSGSIGRLGDIFCDENLSLAKRSIKAFHDSGKLVGVSTFATDEKTMKFYRDMGIDMIVTGADYDYIRQESIKTLNLIKRIQEEE